MLQKRTLMIIGMLAASLVGGAVTNFFLGERLMAQAPASIVTTHQVNLVAEGGQLRGVLSAQDERGQASMAFYDGAGQVRGLFGIQPDGTPVIRLFNSDGHRRLLITALGDDALIVVGDEGSGNGVFGAVGGTPVLSFFGDRGLSRVQMQISDGGLPQLALFTSEGERAVTITVGADDAPFLTLYEAGRQRATLGVMQQSMVVNLSDAVRPRLVFGVAKDGRPSINFMDESGNVVQELHGDP